MIPLNYEQTKKIIKDISFFGLFSDSELDQLVACFEEASYTLGKTVCKMGEPGSAFYIIAEGRARVLGRDPEGREVTLTTLSIGSHFGEQALLKGEPHGASVRASGDLSVLVLPKEKFMSLLKQNQKLSSYFENYISDASFRNFIKQCTVFSPISPQQLRKFLDCFTFVSFSAGEFVFREGEVGDAFYLLRSGEVEVIKESQNQQVLSKLKSGDFFGELALLTNAPRAAGIRAKEKVELYKLDKKDFEQIITEVPQIKDAILGIAAGYSEKVREMVTGLSEDGTSDRLGGPGEPGEPNEPGKLENSDQYSLQEDQREKAEEQPFKAEEQPTSEGFVFKKKRKFPVLLQQSEMDCGAASLAMVCRYYGVKISINRMREYANVSREGATMLSLAEAGEALGFKTRGIRTDYEKLLNTQFPAIVHWEGYHYIVVVKATPEEVTVADPAIGLRKLAKEDFIKGWNGVMLQLTPTPELKKVEPSHSTFGRFIPFVTQHKELLVKIVIVSLLIQLLGLAIPIFTQNIVDKVLIQQDAVMLNLMLLGMLVITFFQVATTALRQYMLVFTATQIDMALMIRFFSHVLGLPIKYFEDRKVGDIISRFNENSKIRELLTGTSLSVIMDTLTVAVYLSLMYYYNWKLALLTTAFIPLFVVFTLVYTPAMKKVSRETFQAGAETQSYIVESVSGINTVKALAAEKPVRWKWEEKLDNMMGLQQKGSMVAVAADSTGKVLQTLSTTLVLWYGARLAMGGELSVGQLMAFTALLGSVTGPIIRIVGLWDKLQEARIALERLNDVFESELEQTQSSSVVVMPRIKGHIQLKNVTFRYGKSEKNVLQNIDLEILPGQTIALVGRSGSGKTTLANLVLRLHQPTAGNILIDGIDIRHAYPASIRRQVGVVLQENYLFSGTIRENIAFGHPDAPLQEVITAAMIAGAHEFISELPMGYETIVGERGMNLSGGQRQRIAIARALFNKPKILIMDEATSALDTESEKVIQQNLDKILHDRSTIVIAHRLSTVRNADLIVVLDRGIIVEKGTHYELMEKKGLYFYLNSQQLQG